MAFDRRVDRAAAALRRPWLSALVVPYTRSGNNGILWVGVGALVRRPLRVAAVTWGTLWLNYAVKALVRRERPVLEELDRLVPLPLSPSFPSSHAAMSAAAATALADARPRLRPLWWAMALVMGASRVYVRAHHASDVAVGLALGAAAGRAARPRRGRGH